MNAPATRQQQRHAVVCTKADGRQVVFSVYDDLQAADLTVARLAAVGCAARVVPAASTDAPGLTRRTPAPAA